MDWLDGTWDRAIRTHGEPEVYRTGTERDGHPLYPEGSELLLHHA